MSCSDRNLTKENPMQINLKVPDRLKQAFDERPLETIGVLAAAAAGGAKLIEAVSGVRSKNAYARRNRYPQSRPRR
jgi:hypothetical protein